MAHAVVFLTSVLEGKRKRTSHSADSSISSHESSSQFFSSGESESEMDKKHRQRKQKKHVKTKQSKKKRRESKKEKNIIPSKQRYLFWSRFIITYFRAYLITCVSNEHNHSFDPAQVKKIYLQVSLSVFIETRQVGSLHNKSLFCISQSCGKRDAGHGEWSWGREGAEWEEREACRPTRGNPTGAREPLPAATGHALSGK